MDTLALIDAARVPPDLLPWGRNQEVNAHFLDGTAFLFDARSTAGMMALDLPEEGYGGYTIMEDTPREISKHFNAVRHARGRVLKTGLGLGCFVRMCLTKPEVEHIDVIEIDPGIAAHFGEPFRDNPRVTIRVGDALTMPIRPDAHWDFGWHDIYCDGNDGLQALHVKLITRYMPYCDLQGAWGLPRWARHFSGKLI